MLESFTFWLSVLAGLSLIMRQRWVAVACRSSEVPVARAPIAGNSLRCFSHCAADRAGAPGSAGGVTGADSSQLLPDTIDRGGQADDYAPFVFSLREIRT